VSSAQLTPRRRQLITSLIVACAMFMQNLDSTIIATALPGLVGPVIGPPLGGFIVTMAPDAGAEVSGRAVASKLPGE
jgi:hypothetical protein